MMEKSAINTVNYTVFRGDDWEKLLKFVDKNDQPINITGWTIFFTLKKRKTDEDASAVIKKTITSFNNPADGEVLLSISASELNELLGEYYYDIQIKKADGRILTIISGIITFETDITRRTSP